LIAENWATKKSTNFKLVLALNRAKAKKTLSTLHFGKQQNLANLLGKVLGAKVALAGTLNVQPWFTNIFQKA
jgi:hypothetical protein